MSNSETGDASSIVRDGAYEGISKGAADMKGVIGTVGGTTSGTFKLAMRNYEAATTAPATLHKWHIEL